MSPYLPPPNRAIVWYRRMVWMMPTCVVVTSSVAGMWLAPKFGWWVKLLLWPWWLFNIAFAFALGFFEYKLRPTQVGEAVGSMVTFVMVQFMFVPANLAAFAAIWLLLTGF
ncbi:hypothetical protein WKV53_12850 [Luteolibacter sp. Y139]|uniref:Uncharacterized protein n=2 Tax=Luteolibacter soli TaxID=3135280 RepID=A0ABU9AXB1_9BACT